MADRATTMAIRRKGSLARIFSGIRLLNIYSPTLALTVMSF